MLNVFENSKVKCIMPAKNEVIDIGPCKGVGEIYVVINGKAKALPIPQGSKFVRIVWYPDGPKVEKVA